MAIPQHYQNYKVVYERMNQALLRDGLLARSFGAEQASLHFENLLNTPLNNLSVCYDGSSGCFFLRNDALGHTHVPVLLDYYAAFAPLVIGQYYWQPRAETDRLRYVQQARLELSIFLRHAVGQGLGLLATDAIAGDCTHIRGWNDPAPLGEKACIHLRIEWPGGAPYNRRVPTRDQTRERRPITLQRFLLQVGRAVEEFLQTYPRYSSQGRRLDCGDIMILGVVDVSVGSWQPILQYRPGV